MKLVRLPAPKLTAVQATLVRFIREQGDSRITKQAIQWLSRLNPANLCAEGTVILMAMNGSHLIGLFAVSRFGLDQSLIVVDRRFRTRGIGRALALHMRDLLPKLYVRIAADNDASLRLFQQLGFQMVKACVGPTGKSTLWLAAGDWSYSDWEERVG